jgi:nitrite reductase (NADH) large subunit
MESRIAAIDERQVRLEDGRAFAASRVVLATGVQPNSRLASAAGWRAARHRG